MNETTPFFQSWIFDLILLFGGTIFGFFVATMCASSGQASRDEEWQALLMKAEKEKEDSIKSITTVITSGTPDRE